MRKLNQTTYHRTSGSSLLPSCAAIAAALALTAAAAGGGTTHTVEAIGMSFSPETVTAAPGDTIEWVWVSGGDHTVTSGTNCTHDGQWFNVPLSAANPVVEFEVPADFTGEIPYFCIPHCVFQMTGTIIVEGGVVCPADIAGDDNEVNTQDLLELLGNWGSDGPGAEIAKPNDIVDTADLLELLANWGACE